MPSWRVSRERCSSARKRAGASGCDCDVSEAHGLTVTVRKGKPDTIEHNRDRSLGVSVYFGDRPKVRRGHASTSDLSRAALEQTVDAAAAIARYTAEDDCAGLPDAELLARDAPDLDLFHPWSLAAEEAIEIARRCEAAAFARVEEDPQFRGRERVGCSIPSSCSPTASASWAAIPARGTGSRCAVIAEEKGLMQRDDWYSASRVPSQLADPERARPLRRRARRGAPGRAQDQHPPGAGAVRGAGGDPASSATSFPR